MDNFLTKEAILNADDLKMEEVEVPEWGGTVGVRTITGTERDDFERSVYGNKVMEEETADFKNFRAKLVAMTVVNPADRSRLFSLEDVEALGKKSASGLDKVFAVAQRLAGLGKKDIEELTKNS